MNTDNNLLNRYLDGELSGEELREVERLLESSPELRRKMNALRSADRILRNSAEDSPSSGFTAKVMNKIITSTSRSRKQSPFFTITAGIIGSIIVAYSGFVIVKVMETAEKSQEPTRGISYYFTQIVQQAIGIYSKIDLSMIGALISLSLIITGYFFFENLKHYKNLTR